MSNTEDNIKADIKLLSFDIDNTLIDFNTHKSNFPKTWKKSKPKDDMNTFF